MATIVSLIAAMARNRVIGIENRLPWHLPEDLQYFKRITMGKPVIMGRKTYESIGRPLPGRRNIVVTRSLEWAADGVHIAHSIDEALRLAGEIEEIFVIGGAELYQQAMPFAQRLYLTEVDLTPPGDAHFPPLPDSWIEHTRDAHPDQGRGFGYAFVRYECQQMDINAVNGR
ncbi:dihydrofolate reductase [Chitinivorax tropicus]|uniref:Dihydrofolate reductase n=2 Tax=Chitinivorax tropicus TaxID=714531 RepID=A0A840MST7_9PROT|nr:type 3 dihydrofolate reductase [Chitinivorax tropicus]MBB5019832.1 dihydrofolate reductase [Chitinivorax tropicus]